MGDDEAAFLAAMRADPATRLTRHVYADWLEERGDPRHELVRVCEAMRAVPVWSDDYWAWKARRNELWTRFPIEWLEATGYDGSDYDPIFRDGVPDGVRERWRLIREFTERWHGVSVPDVGGRRDVVAREEARLGLTLPESVRELIAFTHDVGDEGNDNGSDWTNLNRSLHESSESFNRDPGNGLSFTGLDITGVGVFEDYLSFTDPPIHYFGQRWSGDSTPTLAGPTTTAWMFQSLCWMLWHNYSLRGRPQQPNTYVNQVAGGLSIHAHFDDAVVFEANEILVSIYDVLPEAHVTVSARRLVPAASLPACLFEDATCSDPATGLWPFFSPRRWDATLTRRKDGWFSPWVSVLRLAGVVAVRHLPPMMP